MNDSGCFNEWRDFMPQFEGLLSSRGGVDYSLVFEKALSHLKRVVAHPPGGSDVARRRNLGYVNDVFFELMDFDNFPGAFERNAPLAEGLLSESEKAATRLLAGNLQDPDSAKELKTLLQRMNSYQAVCQAFLGNRDKFRACVEVATRCALGDLEELSRGFADEEPRSTEVDARAWMAFEPLAIIGQVDDLPPCYAALVREACEVFLARMGDLGLAASEGSDLVREIEAVCGGGGHDSPYLSRKGLRASGPLPYWVAPKVGEHVVFGRENGRGSAPLEWMILEEGDGRTTLLSNRIVDCAAFADDGSEEPSWDESLLKEHIEESLVYRLFSFEEREYFAGSPRVMSAQQVLTYFPRSSDRIAFPTDFAKSRGLKSDAHGACPYWTSSPGDGASGRVCFISTDGDCISRGYPQDDDAGLGVRLVVDLNVEVHEFARRGSFPDSEAEPWGDSWFEDAPDLGESAGGLDGSCSVRIGPLSERERKTLQILSELGEAGIRQIKTHAGLPPSTVYSVLRRLEEEGLVERRRGKMRALTPSGASVVRGLGATGPRVSGC